MNIDPIDLIRSSVDEFMPHASAERVWARAQSRRRRSFSLSTLVTGVSSAAAAIILALTTTAPASQLAITEFDFEKLVKFERIEPQPGSANAITDGHNFSAYYEVRVTASSTSLVSASIVSGVFDLKMDRALAGLSTSDSPALIQIAGWTQRYGVQVCALPRLQRLVAVPSRSIQGHALPCLFFESYLPLLWWDQPSFLEPKK